MAKGKSDTQTESLNLFQKLAIIRKSVEVIKKTKQGFGYTYTPEDEILARITAQFDKLHLSCLPHVVPGTITVTPWSYKKTKVGKDKVSIYEELNNEVLVSGEIIFTWINNDNPSERLDVPWSIVGQQGDASQAFGSGLTYSTRYFYLKFFNVSTVEDDPDNWRSKQRAVEEEEEAALTKSILESVDELSKGFVESSKDKDDARKKLLDITSKYVKGGNYNKITDSKLASKLLKEISGLEENKEK